MIVSLAFLGASAYFFLFSPDKEAASENGTITELNKTYVGSILKVTATDLQIQTDPFDNDLTAEVYFVVENVSSNNTLISSASFDAYVDNVAALGTNISDLNVNGEYLSADLAPGKLAKGYYSVEITKDAKVLEIHVQEGYTDNKAVFVFDIPWDTEQVTSTSAEAPDSTIQGTTATAGTTNPTQKPTTTKAPTSATTAPPQAANNTISYAKFLAIQMGMSYKEVCELVGTEGTPSAENDDTLFYTWQGAEGISNISLAFQNDRLISKAQSGLSNPDAPAGTVGITLEEYNQLENGMSYEQVCQIIGGEGALNSETGNGDSSYHSVIYVWNGESSISNASIAFNNGKLTAKAQYGLD